ncbi:FAD-dependent oxidoreductase [Maliponia aquimaris]|uniref:tRNA 5-methylaminomethyl-2-thiouridine biosynthesis bifunctional protein MnmC n=1 Tax=Maliponia aquimaris TaxID=1673631 RepID=A0A238K7Y5_9RHOB|nr:FAD-dependent oxidoreductase [Maliponia aquimaris]SMX38597.1 tRNA 5-methylaminomethyl-2-thiouridine biosynthesis bifunctional protein MnmC [Maliponia aquimaris]
MTVAVLGGGLQGCCLALALAERGQRVALFDKNASLISRAGAANEGKIHLGYMYANDPSLRTAAMMARGALAFDPFMRRFLGSGSPAFATSSPAAYVVHRDSQRPAGEVAEYLQAAHDRIVETVNGGTAQYFGQDVMARPRSWTRAERENEFDGTVAVAAFETCEVAVNPTALARELGDCVLAHPNIDVHLNCEIRLAEPEGSSIAVTGQCAGEEFRRLFDHAVNALWDGRLALDRSFGLSPGRPWLHRLKYGVSLDLPKGAPLPKSATFISGPFGEVVTYPDGQIYLTWYPTCLRAMTSAVTPPDWPNRCEGALRDEILSGTLSQMSAFIPALRGLDPRDLPGAIVKGGAIVAVGETDIYDPQSELHNRYEIGITSAGRYHSIDPGKLTMAPFFADTFARTLLDS